MNRVDWGSATDRAWLKKAWHVIPMCFTHLWLTKDRIWLLFNLTIKNNINLVSPVAEVMKNGIL